MPSYTQRSLATLRDRRIDEERQAERALAGALAAQREAEAETARLDARVGVARAALEDARAACARARQRREVVDKAIARREAVARREAERRAEAEIDDRAPGPRPRPRST